MCHLIQIVGKHGIIIVDHLSQMSVCDECFVSLAVVCGSGELQSHHLEFVFGSSSGRVHMEFDVFDVYYDKFSQSLSRTYWGELVLVIGRAVNLEGAHRVYVDQMHKGGNFVDKHERADASQGFGSLWWKYD